jgi:hypothetical protein
VECTPRVRLMCHPCLRPHTVTYIFAPIADLFVGE